MDKRFWAVVLVIVLGFVGIIWVTSDKSKAPANNTNGDTGTTNHVEGKGSTGIKLVEYGDYQCPACFQYYQIVKDVVAKYSDKITFQFSHYPLTQLHQNAFAASRAAEAAGLQNKYWEMHDVLYQRQSEWSAASNAQNYFDTYAEQIGLNVNQFKSDYASEKVSKAINADMEAGRKLGITGTPTFYLDGQKLDGLTPTDQAFSDVLDAAIKAKQNKQ